MKVGLVVVAIITSHYLGLREGRIAECRVGWEVIEKAHDTWDRCDSRLGRSALTAWP